MENLTQRIEALDPYESQGYAVTRLKASKELMLKYPAKAALAFEIMDFCKQFYPAELVDSYNKIPLAHLSSIFINDYKSLSHFVNESIKGIENEINSNSRYIATIKNNKEKQFWLSANKSHEASITTIKNTYQQYINEPTH